MSIFDQLLTRGIKCLNSGFKYAPTVAQGYGFFKTMSLEYWKESGLPLLIFGHSASFYGPQGYCVLVLNPKPELIKRIIPVGNLSPAKIKRLVSRMCDAALRVDIDRHKHATVTMKYMARNSSIDFS